MWPRCAEENQVKLAIKQVRSAIGRSKKQKATIEALGIKRISQEVLHNDTPQIRGMVKKIVHLVEVREIDE